MTLTGFFVAAAGAVFLGIQTSISPCPLATNIAAVSYIGRHAGKPGRVFLTGLLYAFGRTAAYLALSLALLFSVRLTAEETTRFFQSFFHGYLGPVLILIGMVLLGLLTIPLPGIKSEKAQKLLDRLGPVGAVPVGAVFALAFCPTSAATFLAMLVLAAQAKSPVLFPALYGIATALPVLLFAVIIAYNVKLLGNAFRTAAHVDSFTRLAAGILFVLIGIWYSLRYVYGIL